MKSNRWHVLLGCFVVSLSTFIQTEVIAQSIANPIITAVPYLRIVPDARSAAMGDGGMALSPDANSIHANSSRLAFVTDKWGASLNYTPWLSSIGIKNIFVGYASGYYSINDKHTVAASLRYFSLGTVNLFSPNGDTLGTARPNEYDFSLSYNRALSDKLAVGITTRLIYSDLAPGQMVGSVQIFPARSGAVDFSGTYNTNLNLGKKSGTLRFALAISNIGYKIKYTDSAVAGDYMPMNLGIGTAFDLNLNESNRFTFAFDVNKLLVPTPSMDFRSYSAIGGALKSFGDAPGGFSEEINELMYSVGMEYLLKKRYAFRAGYYSEHELKGGRKYFTLGIGASYNVFTLNISYLAPKPNLRSPLDNTIRFSLLINFSEKEVME